MSEDRFEAWWAKIVLVPKPTDMMYDSVKKIARSAYEEGKDAGYSEGWDEGYTEGGDQEFYASLGVREK